MGTATTPPDLETMAMKHLVFFATTGLALLFQPTTILAQNVTHSTITVQSHQVTGASADANRASLILTIEGVRSPTGKIRAALLKSDEQSGVARTVGGQIKPATMGTMSLTFDGLEPGDYAVQLFHDENDNGIMDRNLFGLPSEGYGFSNGAKASFGPPQFTQMQVRVATTPISTNAILVY